MILRVLVVDDSVVYRRLVSEALSALPGVEVVGSAANGRIALSRIRSCELDLVTLDIEMPEMNGLETLEAIRAEGLDVGALVLSALTVRGSDMTMRALELGAFDFVTKPDVASPEVGREQLKAALAPLVRAYAHRREIRGILRRATCVEPTSPRKASAPAASVPALGPGTGMKPAANPQGPARLSFEPKPTVKPPARTCRSEVLAIGISTGGPSALAELIPRLPADLGAPILIVQHMPPLFTASLARSLDARSPCAVKEATNGEPARPGVVYIAPGGRQMKVMAGVDGAAVIRITDDPPENNCRPAVDYLFRSVAHFYGEKATAVIMTGMGNDGALGMRLLKRAGAATIAQDEASCVVYGMPKEAVEAGVVDVVAPLSSLAGEILKTFRRPQ